MTKKVAKITKKGKNIFPEFKRYSRIINECIGVKTVTVYNFESLDEAQSKVEKLKGWRKLAIVRARSDKGYYAKGWVLICCK